MKQSYFTYPSTIIIANIIACIFIIFISTTAHVLAASRLEGINSSSKFLVYYGGIYDWGGGTYMMSRENKRAINMEILYNFDLVILEARSPGITPKIVSILQEHGVRVLAYINIGEDANIAPIIPGDKKGPVYSNGTTIIEREDGKIASFYVDQEWNGVGYVSDGKPDTNSVFGGRFVIPNAEWRTVIKNQRLGGSVLPGRDLAGLDQIAGERSSDSDTDRTHNYGFDGFFLDMLDTAAPFTGAYPWTAEEMRNTVKFIHDTYPDKIVFANRGLFFYNPNLFNPTFNIRPYDFTVRPYIHAMLFESYTLDSSQTHSGVTPYFPDHKHNYAQKVIAEANRPDGFSVFCLDYKMKRGSALYAYAARESAVKNGWVEYIIPNTYIDTVSTYMLDNPLQEDTNPPVWDSTGSPSYTSADMPDRVGIQSVRVGHNPGEVVIHWDIARDQSLPIEYNIYRSSDPNFYSYTVYPNVVYEIGDGWAQNTTNAFANKYTITGLAQGTYYFMVRAQDSSPLPLEDGNNIRLSIRLGEEVSNPAANIIVDGNLSDWNSLTHFNSDPDDIQGETNPVDWLKIYMAHDSLNFYMAFENDDNIPLDKGWAFSIYLDTDGDQNTGFKGMNNDFSLGAEYLIQEAEKIYRYAGNGTSWNWNLTGMTTETAINGQYAEFSYLRSVINNPTFISILAYGDNIGTGGNTDDWYPDNPSGTGSYEIPKTGWSVMYVDSEELIDINGSASNAFDGDTNTIWHTQLTGDPPLPNPHEIQIDLGQSYWIKGFKYLPRQDDSKNGRISQYELYVSNDSNNWGELVSTGFFANDASEKGGFFTPIRRQFVRLRAITEVNGNPWTSMAEITVIAIQADVSGNGGTLNYRVTD